MLLSYFCFSILLYFKTFFHLRTDGRDHKYCCDGKWLHLLSCGQAIKFSASSEGRTKRSGEWHWMN